MKFGVFSPAGYIEEGQLDEGLNLIHAAGHEIFLHPQTYARWHQMAGRAEERAGAFHDLLKDDTIDAIWCAGGGNGGIHMLPHIDFNLFQQCMKPVIGFSDCTALLNACARSKGSFMVHGPVIKTILRCREDLGLLFDILSGASSTIDMRDENLDVLKGGVATGPLIGGNLSVFSALIGTPYLPDTNGAILFLEDINIETSALDRYLAQLHISGLLGKAAGLIIGNLTNMGDSGRPYGLSSRECILEATGNLDMPVIFNAPFGHEQRNIPLPLGQTVKLTAKDGQTYLDFANLISAPKTGTPA